MLRARFISLSVIVMHRLKNDILGNKGAAVIIAEPPAFLASGTRLLAAVVDVWSDAAVTEHAAERCPHKTRIQQ